MSMTRDIPAPSRRRRMPQGLIAARNILTFLAKTPTSLFGLIVLGLLIAVALFAPLLATHDPYMQDLQNTLQPPSAAHLFGTDELGRNNHERVMAVNERLKALGVRTWIDAEQMRDAILNKMVQGIERSSVIVDTP